MSDRLRFLLFLILSGSGPAGGASSGASNFSFASQSGLIALLLGDF